MKHLPLAVLAISASLVLAGCATTGGSVSSGDAAATPAPVAAVSTPSPTPTPDVPDCNGFARWLNQPGIGPFEKIAFPVGFQSVWATTPPVCAAETGSYQEYLVLASVQQVRAGLLAHGGAVIGNASQPNAEISIIGTKFAPVPSLVAAAGDAQTPGFTDETTLPVTDDYSLWVDRCGDDPTCQQ